MKDGIHIVCTIDDKYAQHCAVMLTSLFLNNKQSHFIIYIITNGLHRKNQKGLNKLVKKYKAQSYFYIIDEKILENAPITHHVSLATYYRILLPKILPNSLEKVLFLDSDLLILDDISPLWNININEYYIGGCCEYPSTERKVGLGLKPESSYFNAGVMLVNLTKWRIDGILDKALNFIKNYPDRIQFWDQDVLNVILENKWLQLSHKWNVNQKFYVIPYSYDYFKISKTEYNLLGNSPSILHFTGSNKPWDKNNAHPKKEEYFTYLKYCSFQPYISDKKTIYNRFKNGILKLNNLIGKKTDLKIKNT